MYLLIHKYRLLICYPLVRESLFFLRDCENKLDMLGNQSKNDTFFSLVKTVPVIEKVCVPTLTTTLYVK